MQPSMVLKYMSFSASGILLYCLGISAAEAAGPVAHPPYKLSVFARGSLVNTQPDSIELWGQSVLIGYGNGVAKDGSDGKFSTIVQYSLSGAVERSFRVQGHNDGLRLVGPNTLWALQNEDANSRLFVIDLPTGKQKEFFFQNRFLMAADMTISEFKTATFTSPRQTPTSTPRA